MELVHRVEHRHVVGAGLERAVDRAVGVHRRVALVGRRLVVQVGGGIGPVPLGHDDVALDPLGPRRRRRHLAGHDAAGPVGVHLERAAAPHPVEPGNHVAPGLAGLDAAVPGLHERVELAELGRNLARGLVPEPVTGGASAGFQAAQPCGLVGHARRDAVAVGAGAGELVVTRHLEQGVPVAGGVVVRGGLRVGRRHRGQIDAGPRRRLLLRRIDEPVAAHPHVVGRVRQVRHDVAALVVGDHGAVEPGRQVHGLGDDPDARLRPVGPGHHPADVVVVDGHHLLRAQSGLQRQQADGQTAGDRSKKRQHPASHLVSLPGWSASGPVPSIRTRLVRSCILISTWACRNVNHPTSARRRFGRLPRLTAGDPCGVPFRSVAPRRQGIMMEPDFYDVPAREV